MQVATLNGHATDKGNLFRSHRLTEALPVHEERSMSEAGNERLRNDAMHARSFSCISIIIIIIIIISNLNRQSSSASLAKHLYSMACQL